MNGKFVKLAFFAASSERRFTQRLSYAEIAETVSTLFKKLD
jgi:hypothetical protein